MHNQVYMCLSGSRMTEPCMYGYHIYNHSSNSSWVGPQNLTALEYLLCLATLHGVWQHLSNALRTNMGWTNSLQMDQKFQKIRSRRDHFFTNIGPPQTKNFMTVPLLPSGKLMGLQNNRKKSRINFSNESRWWNWIKPFSRQKFRPIYFIQPIV